MNKLKKWSLWMAVFCMSICILNACQKTADAGADTGTDTASGYTIDNIRDYVVGLDEEMELK